MLFTVEPGYGDAFEENQEQQTHPAGRIVVEQFEHVEAALSREERCGSDWFRKSVWDTWKQRRALAKLFRPGLRCETHEDYA